MAYLTVDPTNGLNRLALAAVDGSNSKDLLPGAPFPTVDAHRFTPDDQMLAFISQSGIYVSRMDGSGLQQLSNQLVIGTLDWLR